MTHAFDVDRLRVRVLEDELDLARAAVSEAVSAQPRTVMFAAGASQHEFLRQLPESPVEWSRVTGFHMDEYLGVSGDDPVSFRRYMRERVVAPLGLETFHEIQGDAPDPEVECERYAALLDAHQLDLCCLGIGENGHLAFNDPHEADFEDPRAVKIVTLDDDCRRQQVGEGHFATVGDVPARAITVTIPALMRARRVVAIVPGARKAEPVRRALEDPIETACPASILRRHPRATLLLDSGSASGLARVSQ